MSEFEKYRATLPLHQMLVSANCCKHAFEYQQAIINDLRAQLNNMEQCYIGKKKQVEDALHILDELYRKGLFAKPKAVSEAISVLRGEHE